MSERLLIRILDATVERQDVKGRNGTFVAERQYGIADLPNGERRKVRIRVPRDLGPYKVGSYTVGDASFGVGQYGDLEIANLQLVPVAERSVSAASPGLSSARV
jgi:helix-destabilizing protein